MPSEPTPSLEEAVRLVMQIAQLVGEAPKLTAKDRTRSLKLRKGGEWVIPAIAELSAKFELTLGSHPTAAMVEEVKRAQSLIPLERELLIAAKRVADQIFVASSSSWATATVHYTMLRRLAKTNGELQAALAPVEAFFAKRSPAVLAEERAKRAARKAARTAKKEEPQGSAT